MNARRPLAPLVPLGAMVAGALAGPPAAAAHLVTTGLGPFYDGMSHLLLTPQDLLPLLAIALWAGLRGPDRSRWLMFTLPAAWFAGGLLGSARVDEIAWPVVTSLSVLFVGALLAADREASPRVVAAIGAGIGLLHGYLNGTAMAAAGLGLGGLLGIGAASFILVALAAAVGVRLRDGWTRVAVRVAGSWVLATGLFMLGWTLR